MNIIAELSNNTSSVTNLSNGEFETILPEPILINDGDVIQIKNAFIDTIQQSSSSQIYFSSDVNLRLQVCYYEIDVPMYNGTTENVKVYSAGHTSPAAPINANAEMYLCFTGDENNRLLVRNDIYGIIKAGLYTPQSLAIELTKQFTVLNSPQSGVDNPLGGNYFTINIEIAGSEYSHTFIKLVPNSEPSQCILAYSDSYQYANIARTPNYYTGSRQVAIVYNDQNDNKFQFQFLHSPYYDDAGNMSIQWVGRAITRETGCMFLDMQPRDFWTNLGFNVPSMIPTFTDYTNIMPQLLYFDNAKMTTENLFTIDDIYGNQFGTAGSGKLARQITYATKISNYTRGMYANQYYSFKNLPPFLLVELLTNFNSLYMTGNDRSKFISAIIPRYYTQNNYITTYSDSSIAYQHKGSSFILSNIRTRILNSQTRQIEQDLGPNNYILLNIIKNS